MLLVVFSDGMLAWINTPQSEAEDEEKGSAIVSNSTQFLSVGLVLITTMAFGATFALPGG